MDLIVTEQQVFRGSVPMTATEGLGQDSRERRLMPRAKERPPRGAALSWELLDEQPANAAPAGRVCEHSVPAAALRMLAARV
jgi:hypothetical protein